MKKFLVVVALLTVCLLPFVHRYYTPPYAQVPAQHHQSLLELKGIQRRAMHFIVTKGEEKAGCTAYAISAHVLLTADHCTQPDSKLYLDQKKDKLVRESEFIAAFYDHHDHVLLVLPNDTFVDTIQYNPKDSPELYQSESVYFWGNPKGIFDQYREGYVTGIQLVTAKQIGEGEAVDTKAPIILFAMPTIAGDSGSAVFDANTGKLIAVVTYGIMDSKFAGGYTLAFSPEQVKDAIRMGNGAKGLPYYLDGN